jgi:hypothetical protein
VRQKAQAAVEKTRAPAQSAPVADNQLQGPVRHVSQGSNPCRHGNANPFSFSVFQATLVEIRLFLI